MSDYVRRLRGKVGHDLLFMPSTHVLIRDGAGRILLVRHFEGRWQLPGGAVEPGETPADAARRECLEEADIDVELLRIAGVYGGPEYRITYSNGDEAAWVVTVFEGRIVGGDPVPSDDETIDVGWFHPAEIDELPHSQAMRLTLEDALAGRSFR